MNQDYFHLVAAFIGALCAYESNIVLRAKGPWLRDKRLILSTSVEFIWFIIVCLGVFSWDYTGSKALSCLIFLVNYLVACAYTLYLFRNVSDFQSLEDFQLPRWYLEYYFSFGVVYLLVNLALFL